MSEVTESAVPDSNTEVAEDTTTTVEASDVPAEVVDQFNIDELINASFDDDPVMNQEHHKIGVPYQEVLKHIPENDVRLFRTYGLLTQRRHKRLRL